MGRAYPVVDMPAMAWQRLVWSLGASLCPGEGLQAARKLKSMSVLSLYCGDPKRPGSMWPIHTCASSSSDLMPCALERAEWEPWGPWALPLPLLPAWLWPLPALPPEACTCCLLRPFVPITLWPFQAWWTAGTLEL
ncbi:hypothetical protein P7K49_040179 [Saguinus oedipus]|uniref:Uncharacterized protein n=1 Tax=Saguinus oedipus TaxID=9490 RepID=A0ABQ9T8J7_SAGOE|nr:hypothetical protein P7K49_040179 [Saguinus oedipus]